MVSLPPPIRAELHYSGSWQDITEDVRTADPVTITRGADAESGEPSPTTATLTLNNRHNRYSPRSPRSPLYGLIGRNTPIRLSVDAGGPWVANRADGYARTTAVTGLNATGGLDVRVEVAAASWTAPQVLATRWGNDGSRAWKLIIRDQRLVLFWSPTGTQAGQKSAVSTVPLPAHAGQRLAIRAALDVDTGTGGWAVNFWTGRTAGGQRWQRVGDTVTGSGVTSIASAGTTPLTLSGASGTTDQFGDFVKPVVGNLYGMRLYRGGVLLVDMDVQAQAAAGATTWTDATGRGWERISSAASLTNRHVRMVGEVPAWPPQRHVSGADVVSPIEPAGITRRLGTGRKPLESALLRWVRAARPLECWPLTDGPESRAAGPLIGQAPLRQAGSAAPLPAWTKGTLADWIEPVAGFSGGTIGRLEAALPRYTQATTGWSVDIVHTATGTGMAYTVYALDSATGSDADPETTWQLMVRPQDSFALMRLSTGETTGSSAMVAMVDVPGLNDGKPHHLRLEMIRSGTSSVWTVLVDGVPMATGTQAGIRVNPLRGVHLWWQHGIGGDTSGDLALGYLTYWGNVAPLASEVTRMVRGVTGERSGARAARVAGEMGVPLTVQGQTADQVPMGVQDRQTLLELLGTCAESEVGYVLERRDAAELVFRGHATLESQEPAVVLDYSQGRIAQPFAALDDDKLTRNDVSVTRVGGTVAQPRVLETGPMSVQDPPVGVGRYDVAYDRNVATDEVAGDLAGWYLHLGTYDGLRYPRLTVNLASPHVQHLVDQVLRADVGDVIRLTRLPDPYPPIDVDLLVRGYEEEMGPDAWRITFVCEPAEPWAVGILEDPELSRVDTDGTVLAAAVTATATTLPVTVTDGPAWVTAGVPLNANWNFGAGIDGWSSGGGSTLAWDPARGYGSAGSLRVTAGSSPSTPRAEHAMVPVTPGASYTMGAWLYCAQALPSPGARVYVNWYGSAGEYLATSGPSGPVTTLTPGTWTWMEMTVAAPAGATRAGIGVAILGASAEGAVLWADLVALRPAIAGGSPSDVPFDVRVGGEVMTVTAVTGAGPAQTMTVTRAVSGIATAHSAGADVRLAHPSIIAL